MSYTTPPTQLRRTVLMARRARPDSTVPELPRVASSDLTGPGPFIANARPPILLVEPIESTSGSPP